MLKALLNISELLIAWGLPISLSLISNIFLKKKIERDGYKFTDGYKFITKDSLGVDIIFSLLPVFSWMMCISSLSIIFDNKSYKRHLEDLLKDKSIVPIYYFFNTEIKKRNNKKIKKVILELGTKRIPMEVEKKSSKTRVEENSKIPKEKTKEQVDLTKKLVNSDATLVLKVQTLLVKLKKINPESYKTLNMEYEQLAKEGKLSNFMLKDFLARLLVSLECDIRDASPLIDYLDFLKSSYENKTPISNQIEELSFKVLENITKEIITDINKYSEKDKIIIYKKIALLYLYLIYENKYITIDAIRNSCFNTDALLYGAILNIYELREKGVIEDNLLFDLNESFDLESVTKQIREIKFIGNKKMVKSI